MRVGSDGVGRRRGGGEEEAVPGTGRYAPDMREREGERESRGEKRVRESRGEEGVIGARREREGWKDAVRPGYVRWWPRITMMSLCVCARARACVCV